MVFIFLQCLAMTDLFMYGSGILFYDICMYKFYYPVTNVSLRNKIIYYCFSETDKYNIFISNSEESIVYFSFVVILSFRILINIGVINNVSAKSIERKYIYIYV